MRKELKYGILLLGGVLLPLLLIEGVLQVAAYINFRESRMEEIPPRSGRERVVLCLGDSFTFGVGASTRSLSYPAQLERCLGSRVTLGGPSWRAVNRGWPGMNSAELLHRTPGYLKEIDPDYVCILIGRNNRWNRAEPGGPRSDDWRWEVRTFRFLAILWANLTEGDDVRETGNPGIQEADRLFREGALDKARECLDALRPGVRASGSSEDATRFTEILYRLHDDEAIVEECLYHIEKHGPSGPLCYMLIKPLGRLGRFEEALRRADEAMACVENERKKVPILRARAWIHLKMDQARSALEDILTAYALHKNDGLLEDNLLQVAMNSRKSLLDLPEVVRSMAYDPALGNRVQEVAHAVLTGREVHGKESEFHRKLMEDLVELVALVRAHGAQPVLLTYPERVREVDDCIRALSGQEGVPLVNLIPVFRKQINAKGRSKYFITDGHCTDEGYRLMSLQVANLLISL
jgi:hypothetical protein